jgi:hypothetical protein
MNRSFSRLTVLLITFTFGVLVASAWFLRSNPNPEPTLSSAPSPADKANVAEAVFRYQLRWNKQRPVCFLTLEEREPDETFLKRFVGQTEPRIQRSSRKMSDPYNRIVDADTGELAEYISIVSIKWISDTEAEVHCNVYDGDLGEYKHSVIRQGDTWVVKTCDDMSES